MKKWAFMTSLLFVVLLAFPALVPAAGKISFGNLKIIPGIEGQTIYDDNIYMKPGNDTPTDRTGKKVSDLIYHVKPGLLLNYELPERGNARIGWSGDWAFYNTENKNNWKNNTFNAGIDYKAPSGLIVGVNNSFGLKEDPFGDPNQYGLGRVSKRWEDNLSAKAGVAWGNNTFRTLLLYNFSKQKYASDADYSQNFTNNEYGLSAEARFLPRTWGFVRYLYGIRNYESFDGQQVDGIPVPSLSDNKKADYRYNQVNVGMTWDPGAKLSGELSLGYLWKKYDNPLDRNNNLRSDQSSWVAATNVNYEATATTVITFSVSRALRDLGADSNVYFDDTGIGIGVKQTILTKFIANAGFNFSMNDYNTVQAGTTGDKRSDRNYVINAGLDYQIREWLTFGIAYKYNKKTSNYELFEFTDNQYMASLKIVY